MRVALVVPLITDSRSHNFQQVIRFTEMASRQGAQLVCFPEAVLTGLINNDNPDHDLTLGIEIPGSETEVLESLSEQTGISIALGILEREDKVLYDSAILITPEQGIVMKYRRITSGWHGNKADPQVYKHGTEITLARTKLGNFAFLICGDLFDEDLVAEVRCKKPDFLLVPFARSFPDGSWEQDKWEKEKPFYIEQVKKAGVTTLMTNYLADDSLVGDRSFGGAMVVMPDGTLIAEYPIGKEGMLVVDLFMGINANR